MSNSSLDALLACSSLPLGPAATTFNLPLGPRFAEIENLLARHNGFYAFESALHLFGSGQDATGGSLENWNRSEFWRDSFDGMADEIFCFAEDAFGVQFAIRGDDVVTFDPETGGVEVMAETLEEWASQLTSRWRALTGQPVLHEWQVRNGALQPGYRLLPKQPFVLGGAFAAENLYALDAGRGMVIRAGLATQIRDLPDGSRITYEVGDID